MKFDVPEGVAAGAAQALEGVTDPNVKAMLRIVNASLKRPKPARLTGDELHAITVALAEWTATSEAILNHLPVEIIQRHRRPDSALELVKTAQGKLQQLLDLERKREAEGHRPTAAVR